jgi:hypothetical protein
LVKERILRVSAEVGETRQSVQRLCLPYPVALGAGDHARLNCVLARGIRIVLLRIGSEPQQLLHGGRRGRLRLRDGIRFHACPSARHGAYLKAS